MDKGKGSKTTPKKAAAKAAPAASKAPAAAPAKGKAPAAPAKKGK